MASEHPLFTRRERAPFCGGFAVGLDGKLKGRRDFDVVLIRDSEENMHRIADFEFGLFHQLGRDNQVVAAIAGRHERVRDRVLLDLSIDPKPGVPIERQFPPELIG